MYGACLLSWRRKGDEEEYEVGREIDTYRDTAELIDKASFYLRNPDVAEQMRKSGYQRALRDHTQTTDLENCFEKLDWTQNLYSADAKQGMNARDKRGAVFSVVVPSFNRIAVLEEALESVFAQRFTDFEVIVVDDGSTDGTKDYLNSLRATRQALSPADRGPGAARNLGARHAKGKYVAFLDSDDLWFPWTLEVYRDIIHGHCDPSFIAGKPCVFSIGDELAKVKSGAVRAEWFADYLVSAERWRWYSASSFIIRRDAFVAVGGFTEERGMGRMLI